MLGMVYGRWQIIFLNYLFCRLASCSCIMKTHPFRYNGLLVFTWRHTELFLEAGREV